MLHLHQGSLALHGVQQLVLEGLSAALLPNSNSTLAGSSSSSSGSSPSRLTAALQSSWGLGSGPGSPKAGSPVGTLEQDPAPFLQLERLLLEHRHDGSFSLRQLAPAASSSAPPSLQSLSLQLGAISLTASKQLLLWVQQQWRVQAAARRRGARPQQAAPPPAQDDKQQRLLRLLELLPRDMEAAVASCSVATDSSSSSASAGGGLPLQAAFGLRGFSCRLAKAAAEEGADSGSSASSCAVALTSVRAGWQQLSASLGAASGTGHRQQLLPSAVALSSGAAEWSLDLSPAATGVASQQQQQQQQQGLSQGSLSVVAKVSIGALHTDICHPAVQPLVCQLRQMAAAATAAIKPAPPAVATAETLLPADASGIQGEVGGLGGQRQAQASIGHADSAAPLLAEWHGSVSLGDGSRLLFTDAAGRCCWSSSLASCRLAVQGGSSSTASGSFEADGIEMHALATGSLAGQQHAPVLPPPQMLAAKLLRVQVEHSAQALHQDQQQQQAAGASLDATTAGVHLLLQQQQLAQVASVIVSLLPTPKATAASDAGTAAAAPLASVAAAAASSRRRQRLPLPLRLAFSCADTLVLLPTTVTVPAQHASSGQLQLLPTAPALLLSSMSGRLGGSGGTRLSAEGCCLLYCEGPLSQRFPSRSDALKGECKAPLLCSLDARRRPTSTPLYVGLVRRRGSLRCPDAPRLCLQSKPSWQSSAWTVLLSDRPQRHLQRRQRHWSGRQMLPLYLTRLRLAAAVAAALATAAAACSSMLGLWRPAQMRMRFCAWQRWQITPLSSWRRCLRQCPAAAAAASAARASRARPSSGGRGSRSASRWDSCAWCSRCTHPIVAVTWLWRWRRCTLWSGHSRAVSTA